MSKHSSAPWVYYPSEEAIYSSTGQPVVYETTTNGADINLICAAPELLESLKYLIHLATPNVYPSPDKENSAWAKLQRARNAVAKAEGK